MKYSITGTVKHVGPVETIGAKGFQKRTFTIATGNDKWPNDVPLELHKESAEQAPAPGDKIDAEFYLQGREWQGKHFLSAKCVNWQMVGGQAAQPAPSPAPRAAPQAPSDAIGQDDDSQMPF